jgi:UDP-glucose 4-epimerase
VKWIREKVLVTGGAGFIGSHVVKRLLEEGAKVIVLDNFSEGKKDNVPEACTVINGDIRDRKALDRAGPVDYLFNFGSPSSIILFNSKPVASVDITVCGFLNILEWAKDVKVKKIVYPTSGSVYGSTPVPQSEEDQVLPMNLYGISKLTCEHIARLYSDKLQIIGLRIFAGYGPGEEHKGDFASPITLFLSSMIKDERPIVYGDGTQSRDFVYIDDIIEAIIRSVERDVVGIVNVGSGKAYNFNEVMYCINQSLGKNIEPIYINKPVNYLERTLANITKMKEVLGLTPLDLREGLHRYLQNTRQTGTVQKNKP